MQGGAPASSYGSADDDRECTFQPNIRRAGGGGLTPTKGASSSASATSPSPGTPTAHDRLFRDALERQQAGRAQS